jgi:UDP-glucose 4-epimerase
MCVSPRSIRAGIWSRTPSARPTCWEAVRASGIARIAFPSTGSIYGEPAIFPTPEDALQDYIFRFVSILGERYTYGHIFDFHQQLRAHPEHLDVLGDGRQRKSYLYVQDYLDATRLAVEGAGARLSIFNLETDERCSPNDSIGWISERPGWPPAIIFGRGARMASGSGSRTVDYLRDNLWVCERR